MGHYFAERGYVVASINYRLGFFPLAPSVDRAGYRALQDAHAAVCYLIANADEFGIDTSNIFAAGTSAGAITALNLAFMEEKNRPESTKENGMK
jgi:acetyl esterase/lipase